jgi:hypothetical protein
MPFWVSSSGSREEPGSSLRTFCFSVRNPYVVFRFLNNQDACFYSLYHELSLIVNKYFLNGPFILYSAVRNFALYRSCFSP